MKLCLRCAFINPRWLSFHLWCLSSTLLVLLIDVFEISIKAYYSTPVGESRANYFLNDNIFLSSLVSSHTGYRKSRSLPYGKQPPALPTVSRSPLLIEWNYWIFCSSSSSTSLKPSVWEKLRCRSLKLLKYIWSNPLVRLWKSDP